MLDDKLSQNISLRSLQSQVPAQIVDLTAEGTQSLKNTARVIAFRNFLYSKVSKWEF